MRHLLRHVPKTLLMIALLSLAGAGNAVANAPKAVLLLAAQSEQGVTLTFGPDAQDTGPLSRAMRAPFAQAGIVFVSAANLSSTSETAPQELPLTDVAAAAMVREAGATIAVLVGVSATDQGALRATSLVGQVVRARVRVLDVTAGKAVFDNKAVSASYGNSASVARSQASTKALKNASRGLAGTLLGQWPAKEKLQAEGGRLSLAITGAPGWRPVAAVIRRLAATRGVSGVHALQIRPGRVMLSLRSQQGVASVIASLRRARIHDGSVAVQMSGNTIALRVIMNSSLGTSGIPNG